MGRGNEMDHTSIIVYQCSASHRCLAGCALLQPYLVCRADMVLSRGRAISSPTAFIKMLQTNQGVGKCLCFFCLPLQHQLCHHMLCGRHWNVHILEWIIGCLILRSHSIRLFTFLIPFSSTYVPVLFCRRAWISHP